MSVPRATRFWHNPIVRFHLVRGFAFWIVLEIGAAFLAHSSQKQINGLLALARRERIQVHIPAISVPLIDLTVAIVAAMGYTHVALRRTEDRILLGNLGISGRRLGFMIAASGLLLAACTWCLR